MAYTINKTDGTIFATVPDGTIDQNSSLIMIGKNYAGYGETLDENFVRLLESHANITEPPLPTEGQLWFNQTKASLTVYNGIDFKSLGVTTADVAAPTTSNVAGDIWYDTTNNQLNIYNGTDFILVGPSFSTGEGKSGLILATITDDVASDHLVEELWLSDERMAIISKDPAFTPEALWDGLAEFGTIAPGIQLASIINAETPLFVGTATEAALLGGISATQFLRADQNSAINGTLEISVDGGLIVGTGQEASLNVAANNVVVLENTLAGADMELFVNSGFGVKGITIDGASGYATVPTQIGGTLAIANMDYVNAGDAALQAQIDSFNANVDNTIAIDFQLASTVTSLLTADASLTTLNSTAGRTITAIFTADATPRTVTLNASWKSFGVVSPIIVPATKTLILTLHGTGITEADILCDAVLEN